MLLTSHLVIFSFLWKNSYISNHKFYFNYKKYKKITYKINISYLRIFVLCFFALFPVIHISFHCEGEQVLGWQLNWIVLKLPFHNNTSSRAGLWMSNITIISNTTLQNHKKWKNLARNCKLWPLLADYLLPLANVYLPTQNKKKKYRKKNF